MATPAVPTPTTQLSRGNAIEYKAYVRKFFETGAGTIFVVASCYYDTSGFTVFFEKNSAGQLMLDGAASDRSVLKFGDLLCGKLDKQRECR